MSSTPTTPYVSWFASSRPAAGIGARWRRDGLVIFFLVRRSKCLRLEDLLHRRRDRNPHHIFLAIGPAVALHLHFRPLARRRDTVRTDLEDGPGKRLGGVRQVVIGYCLRLHRRRGDRRN